MSAGGCHAVGGNPCLYSDFASVDIFACRHAGTKIKTQRAAGWCGGGTGMTLLAHLIVAVPYVSFTHIEAGCFYKKTVTSNRL